MAVLAVSADAGNHPEFQQFLHRRRTGYEHGQPHLQFSGHTAGLSEAFGLADGPAHGSAFPDQDEDVGICESVQRGLRSRAYRMGRLSMRREGGEHLFHRLLAADLRRGGNSVEN
jgi:phenylpropionate dioxygenase-like ring-hydroxylating dioxygenase large terminal subunit